MDRENHELLIRIDERVESIQQTVLRLETRLNGYSERIRALERWRSWLAGGIAFLLGIVGIKLSGGPGP